MAINKVYDVVVLTEDRYLNPVNNDPYNANVILEDQLVLEALEQIGLKATRKSWSDPEFNWETTKLCLFRTTWDYFDRYDEFSNWLEQISDKTTLLNSAKIIQWNIDKHYLADLAANGINVCETHFIEPHTKTTLQQLHQNLGWDRTVLKPCISGGGRHTYKLNLDNLEEHEAIFQELIAKEAMMLQPFQDNILTHGEYSYMIMDGQFTHAVQKIAKPGDFRVQDDFGGTVHNYTPSQEEITFAEKTVKACIEEPVYARVDVILDNHNQLAISELELIEPELWFRKNNHAATVLAQGIKNLL